MDKFTVEKREPRANPVYIRLREDTWLVLKNLSENLGVNKSEIVQQCVDFALERMD